MKNNRFYYSDYFYIIKLEKRFSYVEGGFIMKNNTSFSDEEIQGIFEMIENEYYDSLSYNQILNIAKHIDDKGFNPKDKLLALEYAARLRIEMSNYINHVAPNGNDLRKKQYITLEAQTVRIKNAMYPDNIDSKVLYEIDNPEINGITNSLIRELKLRMNNN